MLTGAHELPALPTLLSPLSAELSRSSLTPRSLKDVQKLTPSPIALELSVSVRSDPMHGGDSTKNVNTHSAGADGTVSPEKLERTMFEVEVSTFGDSTSLSGDIRIGTTEVFGSFFLAPHLAQFCAKHPAINIDLLPMPRNINLSKREADTSITLERPTLERFVTTKLLDYRMLPYATEAYLKKAAPIKTLDDLRKHNWFDYIDDLIFTDQQPSLQQWIPNAKSSFRSTSMTAQYQAVQAGLGIAILPCFLGAATAGFVPILSHEIDIKRTYWLTAASERRELARVRTLWDYLKKVAYANSNYLMGESCKMVWV